MEKYEPFAHLKEGADVVVAFSGGVDSSVAVHLCKEAKLKVRAVFLSLLGKENIPYEKLKRGAEKLSVPLEILEYSSLFEEKIIRYCWEEYAQARTPNPCAKCNPLFKFGILSEYAKEKGCAALVTGHYARILRNENGICGLYKGTFLPKDQSYFLFGLTQEQLAGSIFPLGNMNKEEVKTLAASLGLESAKEKESQDICFAPADSSLFGEYLRQKFHGEAITGNFVSPAGKILGKHCGLHRYTIGQRKGMGIALGVPAYVTKLCPHDGNIVVSTLEKDLFSSFATLENTVFTDEKTAEKSEFECEVKVRYRSKGVHCKVIKNGEKCYQIQFDEAERAVTPGQAAVFYDGEHLLGGGWIV